MNDYTVVRGAPDWFSRWMSFGSLAVAAAALYYAYQLQPTDSASLNSMGAVQAGAMQDASQRFVGDDQRDSGERDSGERDSGDQESRRQAGSELQQPVADAARQPIADRQPITDRQPIDWDNSGSIDGTDSAIAGSDSTRPSTPSDSGTSPSPMGSTPDSSDIAASSAGVDDEDLFGTPIEQPTSVAPRLAEVRTLFRPNGQPESITTVIKNVGDGPARVSEVVFRPSAVVELNMEASQASLGESDEEKLVVYFSEIDNLTTTQGKHGDYVRELGQIFTVPAGETAKFNLAIRNPDHRGYGLRGRLSLRLGNGDDFEIEDVTLAFVGS